MTLALSARPLPGSWVRAGRFGLAALVACMGLSLTAGASDAFATYGKVTIKKVNVGGAPGDSFAFQPSAHLSTAGFALKGGGVWSKTVLANAAPYHTDKVFTVSEAAGADYELRSLACKRITSSGTTTDSDTTTSLADRKATIKVSPNEHVECTFTNVRKATLTVTKATYPADAMPKTSFGFTLSPGAGFSLGDGGSWSTSVSPDKAHTVTETDARAKGYKLTGVRCTKLGTEIAGAGDVATRTATVTPRPGEAITCSFANTKVTPALHVTKTGPAYAYVGDTMSFGFTIRNTGNDPLTHVGLSDDRCADVVGPVARHGGNDDDVLEPGEEWAYTCSYVMPAHAIGDVNPVVNTATATARDSAYEVVKAYDEHATKILHPAIDIDKTGPDTAVAGSSIGYTLEVTNPGDVPIGEAGLAVTDARCDAAPMLVSDDDDRTPGTLDPGDRWTYECSVSTSKGDTQVVNVAKVTGTDAYDRSVSDEDTHVTRLEQPPAPPSNTPPSSAPPAPPAAAPAQRVAGTTAISRPARGSASLRGPGSCPSGRTARAVVTGERIARVTFLVDGRRVRTVTKADARGRWVLPVRLRGMRPGAHRVVARVQFARAAQTGDRTLTVTVTKCATQAVAPQFTG